MTRAVPVLVAVGAVLAVLVVYLALGGASFEPTPVADPCDTRAWREPDDPQAVLEQIVLSALDGVACELEVSREELVLAVRDEQSLGAFVDEHGVSRSDAEALVREGIGRAIDDAEEAGALSGFAAALVRRAAETLPPWLLLEAIERLGRLIPP